MKLHHLMAAAVLPLTAVAAQGANAIVNGDFETSSANSPFVTNWLTNGVAGGTTNTYFHDPASHAGQFAETFTGASQGGGANAALFQITDPASVSGATAYNLDFYAKASTVGPSGVGFYMILFFNSANGVIGNTGSQPIVGTSAAFTHNVVPITTPVGTDHIQLEFDAIVGAINGSSSTLTLDDVSFAPVPEPTSIAAVSAASIGLLRRRRRA